ncbi:MAG TPA: WHG domain-containing protein [Aquabacterium sp.]|nr:WHG domain-containing protein [Aquabacterium sp.]
MSSTPKDMRKQREAEQRRKAIIKIVRKLIKKGGVGEISLRKVAELAGYSTTVVYSLFGDKGTLITQAMDEDLLELTAVMREAVAGQVSPLDRIRATARAYIGFGIAHPDEYAFVFMQRRPHAPNESARVQHGDPLQDPYAFARALFAEWAATGQVRQQAMDIDLMTQIFWEGIHGFTARHLVMGLDDVWVPEVPNESHRDLMVEVLLAGLRVQFSAA